MNQTGLPIVVAEGVAKSFRGHRVLDGLDLTLTAGERMALIGSNGAGKTTLIRCLLGEYRHEGTVRLAGADPRRDRTWILKRVGFVPQLPPPLKMPVRELLRYAASLVGIPMDRMADIAIAMGLDMDEALRKPFNKLSGGQKQKLLIGIALGRDCDLLILDEPTANLDPAARQTLFKLLAERLDSAMIISSHRLEEVAALVNRVVEMDRGSVILDDRVEDAVDAAALQDCRIRLARIDEAFARTITEWGFTSSDGIEWIGQVAGPDRLKFLGTLSRYAGVLTAIHMDEARP
ncbi:ABC transporter ATP-binding protein [Magnetospira sp. QH-2]|uniref:ABC transporter ATP-binding protein n=1 Tax=Magnetospira sp. (strain QH-2) TaxID=1288970 RepID=UPI0003E81375|nr:ABC transporter ATP-binding protein [Magnetospira sp. QH-2]CCQ73146.1 ABC-type multidrug transport system, ATPase component [Magnetospira sp. QH-2]